MTTTKKATIASFTLVNGAVKETTGRNLRGEFETFCPAGSKIINTLLATVKPHDATRKVSFTPTNVINLANIRADEKTVMAEITAIIATFGGNARQHWDHSGKAFFALTVNGEQIVVSPKVESIISTVNGKYTKHGMLAYAQTNFSRGFKFLQENTTTIRHGGKITVDTQSKEGRDVIHIFSSYPLRKAMEDHFGIKVDLIPNFNTTTGK